MSQPFDVSLKLILRGSNGIVARSVFAGPVAEWVNVELPATRNPRVDLLARMADGTLKHAELAAQSDTALGERMADYYLAIFRLLREPVEGVVLWASPFHDRSADV